jgi:hypothetical protein
MASQRVANDGVREGGLEPPHSCEYTDLNRARLPFRHSREALRLALIWESLGWPKLGHESWSEVRMAGPRRSSRLNPLLRLERRLDRVLTSAFARAFQSPVDAIEIAAALRRECDDRARLVAPGRVLVPNEFLIDLAAPDYALMEPTLTEIAATLGRAVDDHAEAHGYVFSGPVRVAFAEQIELTTGLFRIRSASIAGDGADDEPEAGAWLEIGTRRISLSEGVFTIGRDEGMDLRLDDPGISRHHCDIEIARDRAVILDQSSTNGTVVSGTPVTRAMLTDRSVISLGSTTLVFRKAGEP